LLGARWEVWAFNVCNNEAYFDARLKDIAEEASTELDLELGTEVLEALSRIRIVDGHVGRGYAETQAKELELLVDVARNTGLMLDPVYNNKALLGLCEEVGSGVLQADSLVFVHTGGGFSTLSKGREIDEYLAMDPGDTVEFKRTELE